MTIRSIITFLSLPEIVYRMETHVVMSDAWKILKRSRFFFLIWGMNRGVELPSYNGPFKIPIDNTINLAEYLKTTTAGIWRPKSQIWRTQQNDCDLKAMWAIIMRSCLQEYTTKPREIAESTEYLPWKHEDLTLMLSSHVRSRAQGCT